MKKLSDAELMREVAGGNTEAFNEIVLRYQQAAWAVAFRFMGDPVEAEDIVQEAFLRILKVAPTYKPTASFSTYLYRVVTRLCIDHTRKRRPEPAPVDMEVVDTAGDPVTVVLQKERERIVRDALQRLPVRQRMVVILKYYEGFSYAEIARIMDTTVKAVERLLARARRTLTKLLSETEI